MVVADVVKFEGPVDSLVWKYPLEDFNATSQLIVDETHEALLIVNGNAADLFLPGRRTLALPNIPLANKLINIPTGGETPFPCKVFFINKVHQMDLLWGTQGPITLEDTIYDIFLHIVLHGSMTIQVSDTRKFMLSMVGFKEQFNAEGVTDKFRGIVSAQVKDCVSNIMIKGLISYFTINANLLEVSGVVKERLDVIFYEYGIEIKYFNIETIDVPDKDYQAISNAKLERTSRIVQGYTWQEERQMVIAEKFASNEGTMGSIGGAVGGFMAGGAFGGTLAELARGALSEERIPSEKPPKDPRGVPSPIKNPNGPGRFDVKKFYEEIKTDGTKIENENAQSGIQQDGSFCAACGAKAAEGDLFCLACGKRIKKVCVECKHPIDNEAAVFCTKCGKKI